MSVFEGRCKICRNNFVTRAPHDTPATEVYRKVDQSFESYDLKNNCSKKSVIFEDYKFQ